MPTGRVNASRLRTDTGSCSGLENLAHGLQERSAAGMRPTGAVRLVSISLACAALWVMTAAVADAQGVPGAPPPPVPGLTGPPPAPSVNGSPPPAPAVPA